MQFISRFDLKPSKKLIDFSKQLTMDLPKERVFGEFKKMLLQGKHISKGLKFLVDSGWVRFFPEIKNLIGVEQNPIWHPEGDVFNHTCCAMDSFASTRISNKKEDLIVGLAVLCHDMGKVTTTKFDIKKQKITSKRHAKAGVKPTVEFISRLTNENGLAESVAKLVCSHMRIDDLTSNKIKDSAIRRLANDVERIDRLVRVVKCDKSGRPPIVPEFDDCDLILKKAHDLKIQDSAPKSIILGRHLIELGIKPGPVFGTIIKKCLEAQIDGLFTDVETGKQFVEKIR